MKLRDYVKLDETQKRERALNRAKAYRLNKANLRASEALDRSHPAIDPAKYARAEKRERASANRLFEHLRAIGQEEAESLNFWCDLCTDFEDL